jgi:hypothetical protein
MDVIEHLMELKGDISRNSALLSTIADKLDNHVIKTDILTERVAKLEAPVSAVSVGKVAGAFAAFTAAVTGAVLGILRLLGRDGF